MEDAKQLPYRLKSVRVSLTKRMKKTYVWLIAVIIFAITLRSAFFIGIGTSDDLSYTCYAKQVASNQHEMPVNHHGTRIGMLYPMGFLYKLFGINDYVSVSISFLLSIAGIVLIFHFGKLLFNEKVGLMAALLLSFNPLDVYFASKLMPDLPSMFFLSLGVYFFLKAEKEAKRSGMNVFYFLTGLSVGIAYLFRENAILIFIFFGVYSLFYRKLKLSYLLIAFGFILCVLLEMYIFYATTGDLFYKLKINQYLEDVFALENNYGRGNLIGLIFAWPSMLFTHIQLRIFYVFIFIALMYCIFYERRKSFPLIIWFVAVLGFLSYGTLNLTSYLPFPSVPRYTMIVSFPALLMLSLFLTSEDRVIKRLKATIIIVLLISSLGSIYFEKQSILLHDMKLAYNDIKEISKTVYTDSRTKEFLEYRSGYTINNIKKFSNCGSSLLKCEDENSFILEPDQIQDAYVLVNKGMIDGFKAIHTYTNFPEWINNPPKEWKVVKKIGKGMTLYYAE